MKIIRKIIENGIYWSFLRVLRRFRKPHNRKIKILMDTIYGMKKQFIDMFSARKDENDDLIAVYDLSSNPITFDFAFVLAAAESLAIKQGRDSFFVYIVRKENDAFKGSPYSSIVDEESLKWRLENIIIPLISLYPKCIGYSILAKEENINLLDKERLIYPRFYSANYAPVMDYKEIFSLLKEDKFIGFSASKQGIRYIKSWLKEKNITRPVVTITLRNYKFDTLRDSNFEQWVKFAKWLIKEGFDPVFIPDTESCFIREERLDDFFVFRESSWNLGLRLALYEESYLSFVIGGPASIAQLNRKVRYISMINIIEGSPLSSRKIFKKMEMKIGENFDFAKWYQVLSWKKDSFDNITQEFQGFLALEKKNKS